MTTQEIISELRKAVDAVTFKRQMHAAADRLEELQRELDGLRRVATRPEPSRLEIAAMLKAGWFANRDADFCATDHKWWIEQADALIAAAKESK